MTASAVAGCPNARRRARPAGRLRGVARRQAQGVLPRPQPVGRELRRHRRESRSRPTAARRTASSTARAAGSTARSSSQTTAMWWSPDSTKVAYYRFDESQVPDYYLQMDQTQVQSAHRRRGVPEGRRAESDRRRVRLRRRRRRRRTKIDVRDGKPFDNDVVGHYVYDVRWSPDGTRAALQPHEPPAEILEFVACRPATGKCRVVVREEWPTGWVENRPPMRFLEGRQALHLGVGAQRLDELLPVRSERQADRSAHDAHDVRGRRAS